MNSFRVTLLVLLALVVGLMFYAVVVLVPEWRTQSAEYEAEQRLAAHQLSRDTHRERMQLIGPEAEDPEVAEARANAEEAARVSEQQRIEAEEKAALELARRRELSARAKTDPSSDALQQTNAIALVADYNKEYNFVVLKPVDQNPLNNGMVVALRRKGRIVCEAVIDSFDEPSGQYTASVKSDSFVSNATEEEISLRTPAVGDDVILSPFPSSADLRFAGDGDSMPSPMQPAANTPAPAPAAPVPSFDESGLPEVDASLTPIQ